MAYEALYRAKAAHILPGGSVQGFIPQIFGATPIVISEFLGSPPDSPTMGWIFFQGGNPEFPVWVGAEVSTGGGNGGGGGTDTGLVAYTHVQGTPALVWIINHPLDFFPNIVAVDSSGSQVEGDVRYVTLSQVVITFSAAFSGQAYLS